MENQNAKCKALRDQLDALEAAIDIQQEALRKATWLDKLIILTSIRSLQRQRLTTLAEIDAEGCLDDQAGGTETTRDCVANVRRFGAVGDGDHDDTEAVGRAIASLLDSEQLELPEANRAQSVFGGTVLFPPGRYRLTRPIRIEKNNITLRGCGQDSTVIQHEGLDQGAYAFVVAQGRRTIHFHDLTFSKGGILFEPNVRQHNAIRQCNFIGTEDYAIRTDREMVTLDVYFCIFRSCRGGIYIGGRASDKIHILNCTFLFGKAHDVYIGSTTIRVEGCDFEIRPLKYQGCADSFIFIEPVSAAQGGSGWGLLLNNRFGGEATSVQPTDPRFDPEIHGGPPHYAVRVGDDSSPADGLYNHCNVIGNQFFSINQHADLYPRLAHLKIERNISHWMLSANFFDDVHSLDGQPHTGYVIQEPDWAHLAAKLGVNLKSSSNAFLNNQVITSRPIFSQGGIGWPMVDGDAQQNSWHKSAPQPEYTDSNALSRDLASWQLRNCSVERNAESPTSMSGDAFTVAKNASGSASLHSTTDAIGDGGPWCFSVWFKANTIDTIRLAVRAMANGNGLFVTRQFENFTRPKDEWHLIYVVVGQSPPQTRAQCIIGLGSEQAPGTLIGDCYLWDPRFEKGTRPQRRWVWPSRATNPELPTNDELWVFDDGNTRQLRIQLAGQVFKVDLTAT